MSTDGSGSDGNANDGNIKLLDIQDEMRNSYLTYAMSVIISRALPDVRDGLKPSQRRILVAMNDLNPFGTRSGVGDNHADRFRRLDRGDVRSPGIKQHIHDPASA